MKKSCFVLMPFSKVDHKDINLDKSDLNYIYKHIIQKCVEEYDENNNQPFKKNVLRFEGNVGSIIDGIIQKVSESDLVIADLTGLNSNVMYELGVRHSLKRGTIIITQDINSLPSDLRDYLAIEYTHSKKSSDYDSNYDSFKILLHNAIKEVLNTDKFDSPVLKYHEGKIRFRREDEIKLLKENVLAMEFLYGEFDDISDIISDIYELNEENVNHLELINILRIKIDNLHTALLDIKLPPESSMLYESFQSSKTLINEILSQFNIAKHYDGYFDKIPLDNQVTSQFKGNIFSILEMNIIDTIASTYQIEMEIVKIKDVFSEDSTFYKDVLEEIEDMLERKMKELNVPEDEIKQIIEK